MLASAIHPEIAQQERVGHSSVGITLDLYSHVLPGIQEDAAAKVDAALRAAIEKVAAGHDSKAFATGGFPLLAQWRLFQLLQALGRVAEWFKAAVLKTAVGATPPWVRIPPLPPASI